MDLTWTQQMFCASVVGSLAALFWPVAIKVWRIEMDKYHASLTVNIPGAVKGLSKRDKNQPSRIERWMLLLIKLIVLPFIRVGMKWLRFIALALFISIISSAVGFAAFMQDKQHLQGLIALGDLALFAAFNYGFMASSVIEEALRSNKNNV